MPLRLGPGPVFVYDSIAASRRWQLYALRSLFVFSLLGSLLVVWLFVCLDEGKPVGSISIKDLAEGGQYFFYAISTTQLMVVLLVAPAATAGAICLDRARGNLTHMLVTDLADGEIVLGKLAARLLPVFGLVAATIPVLAMAGLMGGVIFEAIVGLTLITLVVAAFGCALALAISVRATKLHEVLMAVYGIELLWTLGPLVWLILSETRVVPGVPGWFAGVNPFVLAWAPCAWPDYVSLAWLVGVLGAITLISAGLVAYAMFRLRAELLAGAGLRRSRLGERLESIRARLLGWRRGPSLDGDPVLWREWRRGRPSRLARTVWGAYLAMSLAGTAAGIVTILEDFDSGQMFLTLASGLQVTVGLLLVSLFAPTVLAEERVRGSLDVLLTTPLSTDRIVLAKWRAAYRLVPALALLPAISCLIIAAQAVSHIPAVPGFQQAPEPLSALDRIAYVCLPVALFLSQGAVVASVGLALATWIRRLGRAVAISVTLFTVIALAWIPMIDMGQEIMAELGLWPNMDARSVQFVSSVIGAACPLGGQYFPFETMSWSGGESRVAFYIAQLIVMLATIGIALVVLALTMVTFDRCVGRVSERPRRVPQPPRRRQAPSVPHVKHPTSPHPIIAR